MTKFTDLSPSEYEQTLAADFIDLADELRDIKTEFGLRPYKLHRIRVQWSGGVRGKGQAVVMDELHILPTPKISDISQLSAIVTQIGLQEVGGLFVSEISGRFTEEDLRGGDEGTPIPKDQEVYYEVEFPKRSGTPMKRRFLLSGSPSFNAGRLQWTMKLDKAAQNRSYNGDVR